MRMNEELWLVVAIAAVWAALAAVYALVPGLGMPGYVRVWGGGAVLFLGLAGVLVAVSRKAPRG
ncbi:hypothetical protein HUE56_09780 [Azospirillum oryzae]|uniref:Uncharacterized protein n=1 Tax=Azospirillum oryzae TaxID=286727 RepID=A0A6N1AKF9_9PROT|nr:hypothetical protein [Azospirillum oryzae]KAA0585950.1 hypothetical protein FZ938_22700 [Azospirillum oryzae]QKS50827.1 hypothetical protein HUE56_09780 [Azospirillum oryzae]GLR82277.1 hypothetical protein GCM10007856_49710 [Azospirillum oryzae]